MTLLSPDFLWFVPVILAFTAISGWARSRRLAELEKYLSASPRDRFWPEKPATSIPRRSLLRLTLLSTGGVGILTALAGLGVGSREVQVTQSDVPLSLVLDISQSMVVEDVPWGRLGEAKLLTRRIGSRLPGAPMGLTVFADDTHQLLPPGPDRELLFTYLDVLGPDLVTGQGTQLEVVLSECLRTVREGGIAKPSLFLLMSDGEDSSDPEELLSLARDIRRAGGTLSTVALGTVEGGLVPLGPMNASRLFPNNERTAGSLGTDRTSSANPELLSSLAQAGGGHFAAAHVPDQVSALLEWLEARLGAATPDQPTKEPVDRWAWLVAVVLIALFLEVALRGPMERPKEVVLR
jgi:Ca-activated chloride channel family protein